MRVEEPSTSAIDRVLHWRLEPIFCELSLDELTLIAESSRERRFRSGEVLLREGEVPGASYVIIEGRVCLCSNGRDAMTLESPAALGLGCLLARTGERFEAIAEGRVLALELDADALSDLFEDHFSILVHVVRSVARTLRDSDWETQSDAAAIAYPASPLDLVQKIVLLSKLAFARASFAATVELAESAVELRPASGATIWTAGDPSPWMALVVSGAITRRTNGESVRVGPNRIVGAIDALVGAPRGNTVVAEADCVLLRIDADTIFDLCEDHPEVLLQMLALLARVRFDVSGP